MSTVRYRDYQGEVEFEDGRLVLRILHINDLITTEVDSASKVQAAFAELVEDYLASCAELRRLPDKPFKGLFNVRIPAVLHKEIAFAAADEHVTLNAYVMATLQEKVASRAAMDHNHSERVSPPTSTGFLRLSLVTCPVKLLPASDGEYELERGDGVVIEIEQFMSKHEIDPSYLSNSYYIVPDGFVGHDAYAVIREAMKATGKVALAWVRSSEFEYAMAVEARDNGMLATVLRAADQMRNPDDLFQSIQPVKVTKDMIELAKHIVQAKTASFDPNKLKHRKRLKVLDEGPVSGSSGNVINLMDALRRSIRPKPTPDHDKAAPRRKA